MSHHKYKMEELCLNHFRSCMKCCNNSKQKINLTIIFMKLNSATQGAIAIQILTLLPGKGKATCRSSSPSTPLVPPPALLKPLLSLCPVSTDHTDIPLQHSSLPSKRYFIPAVPGKPSGMPARRASRPAEQSAQLRSS